MKLSSDIVRLFSTLEARAKQFRSALIEFAIRWDASAEALTRTCDQFAKAIPWKTIVELHEAPGALRHKVELQRRLLRAGVVPSDAVACWQGNDVEISPEWLAQEYSKMAEENGFPEFAGELRSLARTLSVGNHHHSLRAIFPAIEGVARKHVYEIGTEFKITSIPSVRTAIGRKLTKAPLEEARATLLIDKFIFSQIDAFDVAYCDDSRANQVELRKRHARIFRFVPNRHHVCHGLDETYSNLHVVNGLTLLWTVMSFASVTIREAKRVPFECDNASKLLSEYKAARRALNSFWMEQLARSTYVEPDAA